MKEIIIIWSNYQICYAIGYMLFIRPYIQKSNFGYKKAIDIVFYTSLIVFSTIKFLNN
jgi:hypothetical protein